MASIENIKEPPNNYEVEMMVISQLLIDNEALYKIIDIDLKPNDFYSKYLRKIYSIILRLVGEWKQADAITIKNKSWLDVSDDILFKALSTTGIEDYARIIKENSIKRNVIISTRKVFWLSFDKDSSIDEIKKEIDKTVNICYSNEEQIWFTEQLADIYQELYEEPKDIIKTNYKLIDKRLRLSKWQLVTIAGRPWMWKSAVMWCFALAMKNIAFFSLEMQNREIAYRMASNISKIPYQIIAWWIGNKPKEIQDWVSEAFEKIIDKKMNVYDKRMSLIDIKLEMKKLKITKWLDVVFIDYLQLIKSYDPWLPRAIQIWQITRELKSLAKELNILIIQGSQLNRGIENRADKTPKLADLRESWDIEQDSDIVIFIDRDKESEPWRITLIISKYRNWEEFEIDLQFDWPTMTVIDEKYRDINTVF